MTAHHVPPLRQIPADAEQIGTPTVTSPPFPWAEIRADAERIAEREPLMKLVLRETVLDCRSAEEMLAGVLARRMSRRPAEEAALKDLLGQVLADDASLLRAAGEDLHAVKARDPACSTLLHAVVNLKGFHALQAHRVAHRLWEQAREEVAHWLSNTVAASLGVDIHPAAHIGLRVMLDHGTGIVVGETAVVEDDVSILQGVTLGGTGKVHGDRHPKVRRGVMLGAGAKVLGNIEVGTMSKIAAGSVVLAAVPAHCTVAGVPAKVVRRHQTTFPATEMNQAI